MPVSAMPDCSETATASQKALSCSGETSALRFSSAWRVARAEADLGESPAERPITTASKKAPGSASLGFAFSSIRRETILAIIKSTSPIPTAKEPREVSKEAEIADSPKSSENKTAASGSSKIRFAVALGEAKASFSSEFCFC